MLLKSDNKTLDLNAVMDLLRRCNTASEFRVFCAADGIDADSVVWAAMRFMLRTFENISDKDIRQDITVEDLYKYRPKDVVDSEVKVWKLGMSLNMLTLPEYHMLIDAIDDQSNLVSEQVDMMTRAKFEDIFLDICTKHGVKVYFNDPAIHDKDNGYAYWNEVHLSKKFSCISIQMAVAFHELAHTIINMKRAKKVKLYKVHSCFNEEFYAWFLAQRLYAKYFGKPFSKKMGNFILDCLRTHSASHYSFKNIFGEKLGQDKKSKASIYA